jgi:aldehyde:ferredoxin oxidoreductase
MFGFMGRILRVNLTDGKFSIESLHEDDLRSFLGGRGLAIRLLYRELAPRIDPLSADNKLVFSVGPINATGIPGDVRFVVAGKSPLTGIWGEANCGGWFAEELKKSGYDALIVEGASEEPVYVWIDNGNIEIRGAKHIWGKCTFETESIIKEETGENVAVATIGPAGENLVKIAAIIHTGRRAAGRSGLGAVMGSKKLKAVAVKGDNEIKVADPSKIKELIRKIVAGALSNPMTITLKEYGQAGFLPDLQYLGILPTRNFKSGVFEAANKISGQIMKKTILIRRDTCPRCPVTCKRVVQVKEGQFAPVLPEYGGPEYESVASLGSLLGVEDLNAICRMNMLCNAYGLDTISTGVNIAFAMECYENGILTERDTDGLKLFFGNSKAAVEMVRKIAFREGFGNILAEGVKNASRKIGRESEKFAMEIKGLEVPMHEPRGKKGLGLIYAVSNRGACHLQSMHDTELELPNMAPEIGIINPLSCLDTSKEKVIAMKKTQDYVAIINSLVLCANIYWFGGVCYKPADLIELLNAVTGWDLTVKELMTIGERINTLCRLFNVREGITRKDDRLPPRFMEPLKGGPTEGYLITEEEFSSMLSNYYEICGWDPETGVPKKEKLIKLGLEFAIG